MGAGMGAQLLKAGLPLTVYNRSRERAAPLLERGADWAATPRELARRADILIAMVADDQASRAVWLGDQGALGAVEPGRLAIECSTVSPDWVRELAGVARQRGCAFLEAPVTGSRPQAESGELLFLVGGEAADLERARPVLRAMGRDVVHLGPHGSGAVLKLVNNYLCGVQAAALAEALVVIERSGLDAERALDILAAGAPGSPLLKALGARMRGRDYRPNFALRLMRKDLSYAAELSQACGVPARTGAAAAEVYRLAAERGCGDDDLSAVVEGLR
jgi:3-hydroxyisobutyrate dehydrogenase